MEGVGESYVPHQAAEAIIFTSRRRKGLREFDYRSV